MVIETPEEPRVLALLERITSLEEMPLFTWSIADGLRRRGKSDLAAQTYELPEALRYIDKTPQNGVYVFFDAHPFRDNPLNLRIVREIAMAYHKCERTIVFVSNRVELPQELQRMSATFKLSLPDQIQIRKLFKEEMELWSCRNNGAKLSGTQEARVIDSAFGRHEPRRCAGLDTLKRTRPLAVVRAEEIQALREWAAERTVMAN